MVITIQSRLPLPASPPRPPSPISSLSSSGLILGNPRHTWLIGDVSTVEMLTIFFYVNTISVERGFNPSSIFFLFVQLSFPFFVGPVSIRLFVCTADFRFSTFARTDCMPARSKIRDCINHHTNRHDATTRPIFYVITRFHKTVIVWKARRTWIVND